MSACKSCIHYSECMEQRGRCREYKDLKGVMEDIEMLNKTAKPSARSKANKAIPEHRISSMPRRDGDPEDKAQ